MTKEEVKGLHDKMEALAGELAEYADDVLILAVVRHEDDRAVPTRQMLHSGRGNFWARIGMAGMFFVNQSVNEVDEADEI